MGNATTGASGWSRSEAIAVGKGAPAPASINGWGATASVKVGAVLEIVNPFTGYGTAAFAVKSGSESYCEVDEVTGAVTGLALAVVLCRGRSLRGTITRLWGQRRLGNHNRGFGGSESDLWKYLWGGTGYRFGNPFASGGGRRSLAEGGSIAYRVKPTSAAHCEVAVDGSVTLEAPGECVVQIRAEAVTNYADSDWIDGATLEVVTGTFWRRLGIRRASVGWERSWSCRRWRRVYLTGRFLYTVTDAGDSGCSFKGRDGADARTLIFTRPWRLPGGIQGGAGVLCQLAPGGSGAGAGRSDHRHCERFHLW